MKNFIIDNTKTLFYALIIAVFIRSILILPGIDGNFIVLSPNADDDNVLV